MQKMKFPAKDFFSKSEQIRRKLQIHSHLLNKSLTDLIVHWSKGRFRTMASTYDDAFLEK